MIFSQAIKDPAMKLIGSYTSPFVRKISVILLEKGITFEFVNELPYNAENGVSQFNPLGKVPALVTDDGETWFDSPIIAEYLEQLGMAPALLPTDAKAALRLRQLEALADGIMDAALTSVREQARPAAQQSESELVRQREKISRALDALEQYAANGVLQSQSLDLANIAVACAIGYLNFRRVSPGWCVERPQLVKLVETLFQRESFARTEPPKA
jgi:glutathione S-transferase